MDIWNSWTQVINQFTPIRQSQDDAQVGVTDQSEFTSKRVPPFRKDYETQTHKQSLLFCKDSPEVFATHLTYPSQSATHWTTRNFDERFLCSNRLTTTNGTLILLLQTDNSNCDIATLLVNIVILRFNLLRLILVCKLFNLTYVILTENNPHWQPPVRTDPPSTGHATNSSSRTPARRMSSQVEWSGKNCSSIMSCILSWAQRSPLPALWKRTRCVTFSLEANEGGVAETNDTNSLAKGRRRPYP